MKGDVQAGVLHLALVMTAYISRFVIDRWWTRTAIAFISLVEYMVIIFRLNPSIFPIQSEKSEPDPFLVQLNDLPRDRLSQRNAGSPIGFHPQLGLHRINSLSMPANPPNPQTH